MTGDGSKLPGINFGNKMPMEKPLTAWKNQPQARLMRKLCAFSAHFSSIISASRKSGF
jgi:hypothetical protein